MSGANGTKPLRALSLRQAQTCEEARSPRCRCRCHGSLHGGHAAADPDGDSPVYDRAFFEALPADDPHHLPTEVERKARKGASRAYTR